MTERLYSLRVGERLQYPSWKSLFSALYLTEEGSMLDCVEGREMIYHILDKIETVRDRNDGFHPELAMQLLSDCKAEYRTGMPISEVKEGIDRLFLGSNEFHSIFDIPTASNSFVSERINSVLGISPEDFTTVRMYGMLPEGGFHHPEDLLHVLRWGNIAYIVLGIPGFVFRANDDHYLIRHRMNVKSSSIKELREKEFVLIEKRCYLAHDTYTGELLKPAIHLDRWTVLDSVKSHYVHPMFVTSPNQSNAMNAMMYLLNALMLNFPVRFLLLMNERMEHDRNKAVANRVCEKIEYYSGMAPEIDDQKVADCFAKTIRPKMEDLINVWEASPTKIQIRSDSEAVKAAMRLGLLPIPPFVERLIYKGITD